MQKFHTLETFFSCLSAGGVTTFPEVKMPSTQRGPPGVSRNFFNHFEGTTFMSYIYVFHWDVLSSIRPLVQLKYLSTFSKYLYFLYYGSILH